MKHAPDVTWKGDMLSTRSEIFTAWKKWLLTQIDLNKIFWNDICVQVNFFWKHANFVVEVKPNFMLIKEIQRMANGQALAPQVSKLLLCKWLHD